MCTLESVLDQFFRLLCVHDASIKLRDLALGEITPVAPTPAPSGEQSTDLREREAGVLTEANECHALRARRRVVPSLSDPRGG